MWLFLVSFDSLGLIDAESLNKALEKSLKENGAQQAHALLPSVTAFLQQQASCLEGAAHKAVINGAAKLTPEDLVKVLPRVAEDLGYVAAGTGPATVPSSAPVPAAATVAAAPASILAAATAHASWIVHSIYSIVHHIPWQLSIFCSAEY